MAFLGGAPNPFRAGAQPSWLIMLPGPPRELMPLAARKRGYVERLENKRYRSTFRQRRIRIGFMAPLNGTPFRSVLAAGIRQAAAVRPGGVLPRRPSASQSALRETQQGALTSLCRPAPRSAQCGSPHGAGRS